MPNRWFLWCLLPCAASLSCSEAASDAAKPSTFCQPSPSLLDTQTVDGVAYYVQQDGNLYTDSGGTCTKAASYFKPGFEEANYSHNANGVFISTPQGLFPVRTEISDSFEAYGSLPDLFVRSMTDTGRFWNALTLQSPLAPNTTDYVALRKCLLNGTCTYKDNRLELAADPTGASNKVIQCTAVSPTPGMATSKASLETTTAYYASGDDLWFQARYYFSETLPYSIADFESEWFEGSPGPRIVFDHGSLAVEGKFWAKPKFRQATPVPVPRNRWVLVKVHLQFDRTNGRIELWQDGIQVLTANGPTLPVSFAIQTNIELGVTATDVATTLYLDDVRLSKQSF